LFDAGWAAPSWPAAHGGRDADVAEQLAWTEEMAAAGAPGPINAIGVANIAPAILAYGTAEQQERFLRPMLRGDEIWSQGMSEPEAGSDLASLRCAARLEGDQFVVDGQKTWNSNGDRADWCQLYVRTDPDAPRHEGITCLLVDMRAPGIEARPIRTMAGDAGFAEVFFDAVRVPRSAVLGEVGKGWHVATRTLSNERAGVAGLYLSLRGKLDRLLASTSPVTSPLARDALAARYIEARLLELLAKRTLAAALAGRAPGPEGSVVKLAWASAEQALAGTAVDVLGIGSLGGPAGHGLLASRSLSIAGGTTEVNKNIVAERVLGLPKEPAPARD
jgi:alkylation response protein AidB-like acyl-CoA dehydrogenase